MNMMNTPCNYDVGLSKTIKGMTAGLLAVVRNWLQVCKLSKNTLIAPERSMESDQIENFFTIGMQLAN